MYEHLVYDDFKFFSPAQLEPRLYERTLTVNGVSKAYCMTGWRIGYAGGPEPLIKAMATIQSQSTSNPTAVSQWAAVEALDGPQDFIAEAQQDLQGAARPLRLDAQPGQRHPLPEAGRRVLRLSVLRRHHRQDRADREEARDRRGLRHRAAGGRRRRRGAGHAVRLGPAFRISYATATSALEEACARIQRFCGNLQIRRRHLLGRPLCSRRQPLSPTIALASPLGEPGEGECAMLRIQSPAATALSRPPLLPTTAGPAASAGPHPGRNAGMLVFVERRLDRRLAAQREVQFQAQ